MDEENPLDFKALRAKFQDEEQLIKQTLRPKPALPEKPKMVPPPQSPTHYMPAGARPSLLTSINQSLESKTIMAPRVVFKDEKKDSKKPILQTNTKSKDIKIKVGKDKGKGGRERLYDDEDVQEPKSKKESKDKKKEATAELVQVTPPPKNNTLKKKGFLGLKKLKKDSIDIPAEPILDSPSAEVSGPVPLIPTPQISVPEILDPQIPVPQSPVPQIPVPQIPVPQIPNQEIPVPLIPDHEIPVPQILVPQIPVPQISDPEIPVPQIPDPQIPDPQILVSQIPEPQIPVPQIPVSQIPLPQIPVSQIPLPQIPVSQIPVPEEFSSLNPDIEPPPTALVPDVPILPSSVSAAATPPPVSTSSDFSPPQVSFPEVQNFPVPNSLGYETPSPTKTLDISPPKSQNEVLPGLPTSITIPEPDLSALVPTRSTPSPDQTPPAGTTEIKTLETPLSPVEPELGSNSLERPLSALSVLERAEEMSPGKKTPPGDMRVFNALEKARRMAHNHQKPASPAVVTPASEGGAPDGPTLFELPPIDYEDKMGKGVPPKPQVNGLDHRSSLLLEGIAEEDVPEQLDVPPPPPPKRPLSEVETRPSALPKPARPRSMEVSAYSAPPLPEDNAVAIPAPAEFSETDMDAPEFETATPEAYSPDLPVSDWGSESPDGPHPPHLLPNGIIPTGEGLPTTPTFEGDHHEAPESPTNRDSMISLPGDQVDSNPSEVTDNVYENISTSKKKGKGDGKKRKGPPKNPYAEPTGTTEEKTKTGRFGKGDKKAAAAAATAAAAEGPDEKELKKKEKQRLEKEKKEQKERQEREKKEQKEREKRENEMRKKFKITGQEDAMYQAVVTVTSKGRKNDLPVNSGDNISIIRTTNCPKGKWLARDDSNNYGYVAVNHVELDIKEMLELGKKAAASRMNSTSVEPEVASNGSRASNHYGNESFTDDSEEWTCDDDEPVSPTEYVEPQLPIVHTRTHSMPDMADAGAEELPINHQHSHSDLVEGSHLQARHEALQKLATFFHPPKSAEPTSSPEPVTAAETITEEAPVPESSPQPPALEIPDIIPPPEQYADFS